ncbi:MAG TPA: pyridoxamine 5'-phosphate oxidase family protein [Phenylobacterium sp.]|nr:pyridoxamine 5'-phosphate oxidase family protein [Phenylobacterium sp.]
MTDHTTDRAAVERRLWNEVENNQTGMLGLTGGDTHQHFQPMTAFVEEDGRQIWFFTRDDTELAQSIGDGQTAMFVVQKNDFQACIGGRLSLEHDTARIEKYWNAVVAAWYPNGKADPHLTMLRFLCDDAQVWISHGGPIRFAWEIAKANATHKTPDVGESSHLSFN